MKKITISALLIGTIAGLIVGCGSKATTSTPTNQEVQNAKQTVEEAQAKANLEKAKENAAVIANTPTTPAKIGDHRKKGQPLQLLNKDGIEVQFTGKTYTNEFGDFSYELSIKNDTDKTIVVQVRNNSINSKMVNGNISTTVAAHKTAIDQMRYYINDLNNVGLTVQDIDTTEFKLHIFEEKSMNVIIDTEPLAITKGE